MRLIGHDPRARAHRRPTSSSLFRGARPGVARILVAGLTLALLPATVVSLHPHPVEAASYSATVLGDTPLRYFRLGEASGATAADASGNGADGTYQGGVVLGQTGAILGDSDTAMQLPGAGYVSLPGAVSFPGDFTVEAWVNMAPGSVTANDAVVGLAGTGNDLNFANCYYRLYDGSTDHIISNVCEGGGAWVHYVVTRRSGALSMFRNGLLDATGSWSGTFTVSAIGAGNHGTVTNGSLDEVAMYSHSLTAAQVVAHYRAGGRSLSTTPALTYQDFSSTTGLQLNGNAQQAGGVARLTTCGTYESGSVFATTAVDATQSFQTAFRFSLHDGSSTPADGIAFVLQSTGTGAVGRYGEGLGYGGIAPSVEVEFDTFLNSWDPNANHVGIMANGDETTYQATATPSFALYGTPLTAWIDYDGGAHLLQVYVDPGTARPAVPLVSAVIDIGQTLGQVAYAGFTGGTGSECSVQDVTSWAFGSGSGPNGVDLLGGGSPSEKLLCLRCHGAPVVTATGDFFHTFTDLAIPGRGVPLALTRTYNAQAASRTGPFGYGWAGSYLASLAVNGTGATVTEEGGSSISFVLTTGGGYIAPRRVLATLVKNADGTYTFTRRARERLTFSVAGQLLSVADLNGNTTSLTYKGSGQLTAVTDATGRAVTLGWTGTHVTSLTDANVVPSRVVQLAYDTAGNLSDVTDVAGGNEHFSYDANHLLLTMRDPRGAVTTNQYDSAARVTQQTDPLNRATTFAYTGDGTVTITDPKGNVTREQYATNELTSETKGYGTPSAATWTYTYDPATLGVTGVTDPDSHSTTATYDAAGNMLASTDALGRQTVNTYDALNDLTSTTDPKGVATTLTYDTSGNLTEVSTPLVGAAPPVSQRASYAHTDAAHPGDVTAVTDADGKVSHLSYDADGDLTSSADPLDETATYSYNADGWLTSSVSPKGNVSGCGCAATYTTAYGHNAFGQTTTVTDPLGHVTTRHYDADGNVDQLTDANGNLTTYVHDAANELTSVHRAGTPETTLVTDYNADGTVLDQQDGAGNTTTYGYDALARVTSATTPPTGACPSGCATTFTYDGAGNRLTQVDPAGTTAYAYDVANELTGIAYSDGATPDVSAITYDADGQRTGMTDGTGTSTWTRDSLHRLTSSTNGAGATVVYDYTTTAGARDLLDRVGHITYPNGVGTVARGFDDAGRLTSLTDLGGATLSFGYDVNSNLVTSSVPSTATVTDTVAVDAADQVTSMSSSNGSTLFSATYGRDGNGQLTSDSSVPAAVAAYRYTPLDQLCYAGSSASSACSSPPAGSQPFRFDAADNLTTDGGITQKFDAAGELCWTSPSVSANACSSTPAGGTTYGYDSRGNRTSVVPAVGSATCIRYDQEDRLISVVGGTGATCASPATRGTYGYDGAGLRQSKTVGGGTTQFAWDVSGGLPLLLQETSGGITTSYVNGPGGLPVEQVVSSRPAISMVGTPSMATDSTGTGGSLALSLPASLAAGDQIIVATTYPAWLGSSASTPSGYTEVGSPVSSGGTSVTADVTQVFAKTAAPGDSSVSINYNGVFPRAATAVVYRGADPSMPLDVVATGTQPGGTSVTASATTRYPNDRLVLVQGASYAATAAGSWTAPAGTAEQAQKDATLVNIGVADAPQAAVGSTGSLTSTFSTSGTFAVQPQLTAVLLVLQVQPAVTYLHHDQLGSTRLLTDLTGAARATFTFDPYGNLAGSTGAVTTPVLYAGQYRDAESGLYFMRARYYDPSTAQFLSRDPLVAKTREPYAYTAGNPLNSSDPTGLDNNCDVIPRPWDMEHSCAALGAASLLSNGVETAGNAIATPVYAPANDQNLACLEQQAQDEGTGWALPWLDRAGTILAIGSLVDGEGEAYFVAEALADSGDASLTVQEFIGKYLKGSVNRAMPGEYLNMTVEEALASGNSKVRKLLTDQRFRK